MTLKKPGLVYTGISVLLLMLVVLTSASYSRLGIWFVSPRTQPVILSAALDCNPLHEPCTAQVEDIAITLQLNGEVRPLEVFNYEVDVKGKGRDAVIAEEVSILFDMKDMSMGFNRFEATRQTENKWRGQAILPICTQGRQYWQATVVVKGDSGSYSGKFSVITAR